MAYQEKRAIVSVVVSVLVFLLYVVIVFPYEPSVLASSIEHQQYWARVILSFIPVGIIARILGIIVFTIFNRIIANEKEPSFDDEYDKFINLKVARNCLYVFTVIFFIGIGVIAFGSGVVGALKLYFYGLAFIGVFVEVSEFYFYRRGV